MDGDPESPRSQDGHAALEAAWSEHKRRLYRLCLRWVGGNPEDAEDALSRVALRAVEDHAARGDVVTNYGGWLTTLAWNLCMDVHRERAFRRRMLDTFAQERLGDAALTEIHPEAGYLQRELGCRIEAAIDGLPPRLREPCRRRFFAEMDYERVSEELGLTNETLRKRIQEARGILRKRLGSELR